METPSPAAGSSPAPTPPPAAPAATPAPAAPVAPASPSPVSSSAPAPTGREILGALSPAERRSVVLGQKKLTDVLVAKGAVNKPATPAAPVEPAAPAPAAEPAATPPADPVAGEADPEGGQPEGGERTPERFRFKDSVDQAVALLAKTKGISLIEAAQLYQGQNNTAPAPAAMLFWPW